MGKGLYQSILVQAFFFASFLTFITEIVTLKGIYLKWWPGVLSKIKIAHLKLPLFILAITGALVLLLLNPDLGSKPVDAVATVPYVKDWIYTVGNSTTSVSPYAVVAAPDGSMYAAGSAGTAGTSVDYDGGAGDDTQVSGPSSTFFVTKYSSTGTYEWTYLSIGASSEGVNHLAVDPITNDVYIGGYFNGTMDFDITAGTDEYTTVAKGAFVLALNADGSYDHTDVITTASGQSAEIRQLEFDSSGNLYVEGLFNGVSLDLDYTGGTNTRSSVVSTKLDIFFSKYSNGNVHQWTRVLGSTGASHTFDWPRIAVNGTDLFLVADMKNGTVDLNDSSGDSNQVFGTSWEGFVVLYDTDGNYQWDTTLRNTGTGYINSYEVGIDSSSNIYFGGEFSGTIDFNGGAGVDTYTDDASSNSDMFLTSYASDGSYRWTKAFGGDDYDSIYSMDVTPSGEAYLIGSSYSLVAEMNPDAGHDYFLNDNQDGVMTITKFATDGSYLWTRTTDDNGFVDAQHWNGFDIGPDDSLYLASYVKITNASSVYDINLNILDDDAGTHLINRTGTTWHAVYSKYSVGNGEELLEDGVRYGAGYGINSAADMKISGRGYWTAPDNGLMTADINLDGVDDLIVVDWNAGGTASDTYVIWGQMLTADLDVDNVSDYGLKIGSHETHEGIGMYFEDFNNDGVKDLLILDDARYETSGKGNIYIVPGSKLSGYGVTTGNDIDLTSSNTYAIKIEGPTGGDLGYSEDRYDIMTIDNIDSDSGKDIMISDRAGNVYVIFSKLLETNWSDPGTIMNMDSGTSYNIRYYDAATTALSLDGNIHFGDLNGDGTKDLAVVNDFTNEPANPQGSVYIIPSAKLTTYNNTTGNDLDLSVSTNFKYRVDNIHNAGNNDFNQVKSGDLDGDGRSDTVVSGYWNSGAGSIFVIPATAYDAYTDPTGNVMDAAAVYMIRVDGSGSDNIGYADDVIIGDINENGKNDLIIVRAYTSNGVFIYFDTFLDDYTGTTGNDLVLTNSAHYSVWIDGSTLPGRYSGHGGFTWAGDQPGYKLMDVYGTGHEDLLLYSPWNNIIGADSGAFWMVGSSYLKSLADTRGTYLEANSSTDSATMGFRYTGLASSRFIQEGDIVRGDFSGGGGASLAIASPSEGDVYILKLGSSVDALDPAYAVKSLLLPGADPTSTPLVGDHTIRLSKGGVVLADAVATFEQGYFNDWDTVHGGADLVGYESYVYGLPLADNTDPTFTLYIPKASSHNRLVVCPGAKSLVEVSTTCAGVTVKQLSDSDVLVVTINGQEYWAVTGVTGTGGLSYALAVPPAADPPIYYASPVVDDEEEEVVQEVVEEVDIPVIEMVEEVAEQEQLPEEPETPSVLAVVFQSIKKVAEYVTSPEVADVVQEAGAIAGAATVVTFVPSVLTSSVSWILRLWHGLLNVLGLRRKGRPYGYIYDAVTKEPLSLVVVRFLDESGSLVATEVTNTYGVFNTSLEGDKYSIGITKSLYQFPSEIVQGVEDYPISNLYHGGVMDLEPGDIEKISIPMDPTDLDLNDRSFAKVKNTSTEVWRKVSLALFSLGAIYSLAMLSTRGDFYDYMIAAFYVLSIAFGYYQSSKGMRVGSVSMGESPLEGVEVLLKKAETDRVLDKRVTKDDGSYYFVVTQGDYEIELSSDIYSETSEDYIIVHEGDKPAIIHRDITVRS